MAKAKAKKYREPFNLKKEIKLLPGYLVLLIWIVFTVVMVGWILAASLSTSKEISQGAVLQFQSGFHFENYALAWGSYNVSKFFMNSLLYAIVSCVLIIAISAPAAYVLSRFKFICNRLIKTGFVVAMSVPAIMIIMPIFALTSTYQISGRGLLIFLYICINVPFTTTYLLGFFSTLSKAYEEAAAIDCRRILCFSKGALGQRMARAQQAGVLFREQHFIYAIPAARLYPEAEEGRKLLIQGVVDAYFEEADGLILVDYKTDYVEKGGEAVLYRKYAAQLNYYTEALEQLTGRKVKEKILYSVRLQKELREN